MSGYFETQSMSGYWYAMFTEIQKDEIFVNGAELGRPIPH